MLTEFLLLKQLSADELLDMPRTHQAIFFNEFQTWRLQKLYRQEAALLAKISDVWCAIRLNTALSVAGDQVIDCELVEA